MRECAVVDASAEVGNGAVQRLQRATGELGISVKYSPTGAVLDDLRQAGCLKARFPRRLTQGRLDAVVLNAGGDRLRVSVTAAPDTSITVAAQAAERLYKALAEPSHVRTSLTAGANADLEWLPQETILFDRFALDRQLTVDLAPDARFLGVETLVFGRAAMGETVRQGWLRDLIRVRRGGELLLHDAIRLDGPIAYLLARPATGAGARVVSTLVHVAPDAGTRLDAVRGALTTLVMVEAAASAWNGMLVARLLGPDSASVRAAVIAALNVLRDSRPLPRVWLC